MQSQPQKIRKKRKPMTEEQKAAAAERLAKARANKAPAKNLYVHESVRELPDDHPLSLDKVRGWIKTQKDIRSSSKVPWSKKTLSPEDKKRRSEYLLADTYVKNMEAYLRTGTWLDLFYGEYRGKKIRTKCTTMAYYHDGPFKGMAKRTVGTWYPDIGTEWTREMNDEAFGTIDVGKKRKKKHK